jgi:hypothetical protein
MPEHSGTSSASYRLARELREARCRRTEKCAKVIKLANIKPE